jgi:hypothetical protein
MNFDTVDLLCSCSNEVVSMAFKEPSVEAAYTIKAIGGLDVDEIFTSYIGKGTGTNPLYNMGIGKREVVVRFAITPRYSIGETVTSLRDNIYRAVSANRTGAMTLQFKNNDLVVAFIKGFTTKIEAPQFTETPEIQLTLDCSKDPVLRSETVYSPSTLAFANNLAQVNDDISTAPHGMGMSFLCGTDVASFTITDESASPWTFTVTPGAFGGETAGFKVGDSLHISSEDGYHQLFVVRDSVTTHLAQALSINSVWPYMYPGQTMFRYSSQFTCTGWIYRHAFWGI